MNDLLWFVTAILAVLLAEAGGPIYQHVTRDHEYPKGGGDA